MPGRLRLFWRSFAENRGAVLGLFIMILLLLLAVFADVVAPHSPIQQFRDHFLAPPVWQQGGTAAFPLGTDDVGRDMLSRLIYGARLSLVIGIAVVTLSLTTGIVLGPDAAFAGGLVDTAIMRLMDIVLVFPSLLLAIVIVAILGPGLFNAMIAVAVVTLPSYTRLTRAAALSELARDYVTATRCAGAGQAAPDVQHRAAELPGAADRAGHARVRHCDPRRGSARVPRSGRAAADTGMGHHAGRAPCSSISAPGGCWHFPVWRSC